MYLKFWSCLDEFERNIGDYYFFIQQFNHFKIDYESSFKLQYESWPNVMNNTIDFFKII